MRMKLGDGNYRHLPQTDYLAPPEDWRAQLFETAGRDDDSSADRPSRRKRRKARQRTPGQDAHAEALTGRSLPRR